MIGGLANATGFAAAAREKIGVIALHKGPEEMLSDGVDRAVVAQSVEMPEDFGDQAGRDEQLEVVSHAIGTLPTAVEEVVM